MLTYPRTLRSGAGSATTPRRRRQNFGRNQALRASFLKSLAVELGFASSIQLFEERLVGERQLTIIGACWPGWEFGNSLGDSLQGFWRCVTIFGFIGRRSFRLG